MKNEAEWEKEEIEYLYQIANVLPGFLEAQGFSAESARGVLESKSEQLHDNVRRITEIIFLIILRVDTSLFISHFTITVHEAIWKCSFGRRQWTIIAEIGAANHKAYEKKQEQERTRRKVIPEGENLYFDEAYERGKRLVNLELKDLDVNMFAAVNNSLINDGCGLYRGRQILPYEHLSRYQNDRLTSYQRAVHLVRHI